MDLTLFEVELHVVEGGHAGKAFVDALEFQYIFAHLLTPRPVCDLYCSSTLAELASITSGSL